MEYIRSENYKDLALSYLNQANQICKWDVLAYNEHGIVFYKNLE
jgi:hypothetical protein